MKKRSLLCMIAVLFVLTSCGEKENKTGELSLAETEVSVSKEEKASVTKREEKVDEPEETLLSGTFRVSDRNDDTRDIYIDVPNWHEVSEGYTHVYSVGEFEYITISFKKFEVAENLDQAMEYVKNEMIEDMDNYFGPTDIVIENSEEVTINGFNLLRYEGYIPCDMDVPYNAPCFGYVGCIDGIPFDILGSVHGQNGDTYTMLGYGTEIFEFDREAAIKEVEELVDAMAQTIRTER